MDIPQSIGTIWEPVSFVGVLPRIKLLKCGYGTFIWMPLSVLMALIRKVRLLNRKTCDVLNLNQHISTANNYYSLEHALFNALFEFMFSLLFKMAK